MTNPTAFSQLPPELRLHIGGFIPPSQSQGYASLPEIAPLAGQMHQITERRIPYTPGLLHLEVFRTDDHRIPPVLLPELHRYPFYSRAIIQYRGELKHGPAKFFDKSGEQVATGQFVDNQKEGLWRIKTTWSDGNATQTISEEGQYLKDTRTGRWTVTITLNSEKPLVIVIPYKAGQKHGMMCIKDPEDYVNLYYMFIKDFLYGESSVVPSTPRFVFYKNRLVMKRTGRTGSKFEFYNEDGTVDQYILGDGGVLTNPDDLRPEPEYQSRPEPDYESIIQGRNLGEMMFDPRMLSWPSGNRPVYRPENYQPTSSYSTMY